MISVILRTLAVFRRPGAGFFRSIACCQWLHFCQRVLDDHGAAVLARIGPVVAQPLTESEFARPVLDVRVPWWLGVPGATA